MSKRTLIIKNLDTGMILASRVDNTNCAGTNRIPKKLYTLLLLKNVVAFYENKPNEIRIPVADPISKRFYVKPPNWDGVLRKGRKDEQYIVNGQVIPPIACPS